MKVNKDKIEQLMKEFQQATEELEELLNKITEIRYQLNKELNS